MFPFKTRGWFTGTTRRGQHAPAVIHGFSCASYSFTAHSAVVLPAAWSADMGMGGPSEASDACMGAYLRYKVVNA